MTIAQPLEAPYGKAVRLRAHRVCMKWRPNYWIMFIADVGILREQAAGLRLCT